MEQNTGTAPPKLRSTRRMKEIMTSYYIDAKTAADRGKKVAWITSGGPVEPLIAMDIIPVYPENHGAMIGAAHMGASLCAQAEGMGYSADLCSYALADIAVVKGGGGPIGGLPRPDFMVCCNNICGTVMKWYEVQSRYFSVPLFIFDTPFIHGSMTEDARVYLRRQVDDYLEFLGNVTGKPVDMERMREAGRLSIEAQRTWQDILDANVNRPAPVSSLDLFMHMALMVTLRGTPIAVEYYQEMKDEVYRRVADGVGAVSAEKYRLLWDNLPLWHSTRFLYDVLAARGGNLVADTYTSAWSGVLSLVDENDFLASMGVAYASIYINISIDIMYKRLSRMIDKYDIDGIIMHSNRSCKPYSFGQFDLRRRLQDEMSIPTLIIESDHVDERQFSESQMKTRIDAFMELVSSRKKGLS